MLLHKSSIAQKRFHMSKKVWIPLAVALIVLAIPTLVLGFMGLVPGLSNIMGSASQRNLGVNFSQQDLTSFQQKTPLNFKNSTLAPISAVDASNKQLLTQPVTVQNVSLSQEEITATLDSHNWSWLPITNTQIRLRTGTVEISGLLNSSHLNAFEQYISNGHALSANATNLISWSRHFRNHVPVYLKAQASVTDNILNFKLEQAQIGRLSIPLDLVVNGTTLRQGIQTNITANNLDVKTAYATNGALNFSGTYPSVIYVKN